MNKKITKLISVCIGIAFCAVPMVGQNKAEAVVKEKTREATLFEKESAKAPDVQLRAAGEAWPDSSVTYTAAGEKSSKTIYSYNANGYQTLAESFTWKDNQWVNSSKSVSERDAAGNETLYQSYSWVNNQWVNSVKVVLGYDAAGHNLLYEYYTWNNNAWVGYSKNMSSFDSNGDRTSYSTYTWKDNQWVLSEKKDNIRKNAGDKVYVTIRNISNFKVIAIGSTTGWYSGGRTWFDEVMPEYKATYNAKGNLILVEISYLESGQRTLWEKYVITYDNDYPRLVESYYSDNTPNWRWVYQYDTKGNLTLYEMYEWDSNKSQWVVDNMKSVSTYDANGRETSEETFTADVENNRWVPSNKYSSEYDAAGNYYSESYSWNVSANRWDGSSKTTSTIVNGNTVLSHSYSWLNNEWALNRYTIYYPNSLTNTNPPTGIADEPTVSPVPTAYAYSGVIYLQSPRSEQVIIYSLSGAKVYEGAVQAGTTTLTARLPKGVYIVAFSGGTRQKVLVSE
jgi:hypothetical protein